MTGPIIQVDSGAFGRNIFVHVSKTVHSVKGVEEVLAGFSENNLLKELRPHQHPDSDAVLMLVLAH